VVLTPQEISEFHRTQIIAQSQLILQATETQFSAPTANPSPKPDSVASHASNILAKLEDPKDFGLVRIYCRPVEKIEIPVAQLTRFLNEHRSHFSETMRYFPKVEVFQNGVSVGYFPSAVRQDVKSTMRISLFNDGFTALDSLADTFLDGDRELHSGWLCYELQRQLQLSKAVLSGSRATRIRVDLDLEHMEAFRLALIVNRVWAQHASYTGAHQPITREVPLDEIHDYDDTGKRNLAMPVVRNIMEELGRIFGLSQVPPNLWDADGYLTYVKGLENQR
jgi:hypothetical protein